jgi:hypothetical protein
MISIRFTGARVYARFRVCDDTPRNLAILVTETRPGVAPANRRFATRVPPRPCGAYTRNWLKPHSVSADLAATRSRCGRVTRPG